MSLVHVIVIKKNNIYFETMHFRSAKQIVESKRIILPFKSSKFLDAGYIVIDVDKKQIINSQCAFNIYHSDFSVIEQ
jgi:hypothetical protein